MSFGKDLSVERPYEGDASISAERAAFIRRTYSHLAGAIAAFALLEWALLTLVFRNDLAIPILRALGTSRFSWLLVLGAFILFGSLARHWASSQTSQGVQYFGLGLYVVLEALIFVPLLLILFLVVPTQALGIIQTAGVLTLAVTAGLTAVVFLTKKDFSFLRSALVVGTCIAFGAIIAAIAFGFTLGIFFCVAMVALMAGYILYDTSNVLHHYHTEQHVAASLALFAAIATMFWYIIQILMYLQRE
jgi:FtsH-binding integral membrane protein